jgi:YgiT-type zinc finger domain-containing protein
MKCLYCRGDLASKRTSYAANRKGYRLILDVPAWVCEQCGEPLFDEETVRAIQNILRSVDAGLERLPAPMGG